MRVHQNQVNSYAQLDAMNAAQKAAAKRQADKTRKKLLEMAPESSCEADSEACVVQFEPHDEQEPSGQKNQTEPPGSKQPGLNRPGSQQYRAEIDSADEHRPISDWI
jgi:hypothetical protein